MKDLGSNLHGVENFKFPHTAEPPFVVSLRAGTQSKKNTTLLWHTSIERYNSKMQVIRLKPEWGLNFLYC